MTENPDPSVIRSIAVDPADVVDAFEYTRANPGTAVLRLTPPFHGRMRARLHVHRGDGVQRGDCEPAETDGSDAVHVAPASLLTDDVVETYPTLESVEAGLPDEEPAPDRLHEALAEERGRWRERALESLVERTTVDHDGENAVDVTRLD